MTTKWGPPLWTLFHTMIEKVREEDFPTVGEELFAFIRRTCNLLPCPECQKHAKIHLHNTRINVRSKTDVREFIHKFHNAVNKFKKMPEPPISILDQYKENNLATVYNQFVAVFGVNGNVRLFADTMQRTMLLREFKTWLLGTAAFFPKRS